MAERKGSCFFIAPIGEPGSETRWQSDTALIYVARPALEDTYEIKRADEDAMPGQISPQLIRDIDEAELIVCDLTGLNPNVMLELGIALALAKRVIQIADVDTHLPFDLAHSRTIFFNLRDPQSHRVAIEEIRRAEAQLRIARRVSNLVTDSLARVTAEDFRDGISPYEDLLVRVTELERRAAGSADPVGRTLKRAEQALMEASVIDGKEQVEAAGEVIDLLVTRPGFRRVAIDRTAERRLIVYGEATLDTSDVVDLINDFDVEFRLGRRRS